MFIFQMRSVYRTGLIASAITAAILLSLAGCDRQSPQEVIVGVEKHLEGAASGTPPSIGGYNVYYGHVHNHSSVSDGSGTPDQAYNYAKNSANLDFFGLADHSGSISSTEWTSIKNAANAYNQDNVFVGFYGFEWSSSSAYGHVTVINTDDYCTTGSPTNNFSGLINWLSSRNGAAFCNHPGREDGSGLEFSHFTTTPSSKVVGMELWNKSDPFSDYYYNDGYYTNDNNKGYWDEANSRGWKLGASGAEDNHSPTWGTSNDYRMAILATTLTRQELFDAINARRFYSTLDKNLSLSFKINSNEMGSTIPGGVYTAQILASDGNGEIFTEVVMFDKNHNVVQTWTPSGSTVNVSRTLTTGDGDYYYVKVKQTDGNEAISSPIWISGGTPVNQTPIANAGVDQTISDIDNNGSETVTLNGSSSSDPDGSITSWVWSEDSIQIATGVTAQLPLSVGTHTITLTVTDNGGLTSNDNVIITITPYSTTPVTISKRIATGLDDVEERQSDGYIYTNSSDIELVNDGTTPGNQHIGLRFTGISIPKGTTITNAYIQFTCDEKTTATTALSINGEAADNAPQFSTAAYNVTNRLKTTSMVSWNPSAWNTVGQSSTTQRTPNLKTIVQEIVNRSGWNAGNAIAFIIEGTGKRTAEAYEGSNSQAALLVVTYQ